MYLFILFIDFFYYCMCLFFLFICFYRFIHFLYVFVFYLLIYFLCATMFLKLFNYLLFNYLIIYLFIHLWPTNCFIPNKKCWGIECPKRILKWIHDQWTNKIWDVSTTKKWSKGPLQCVHTPRQGNSAGGLTRHGLGSAVLYHGFCGIWRWRPTIGVSKNTPNGVIFCSESANEFNLFKCQAAKVSSRFTIFLTYSNEALSA